MFVKKLMLPFPNISRIGLTLNLDLSPTDLNTDRCHLLITDDLPTKFKERSCIISCARCQRPTWPLTFTLWPTDLNINGVIYSSRAIYLPTKFETSWAKHSWVISNTRWRRQTWPLTLTSDLLTWISKGIIYWSRTIYLQSLKLIGQSILELSVAQG